MPDERKESTREAETIPANEARARLFELTNRAAMRGERFVITRFGKAVGAIVGPDDLAKLEQPAA